MRNVYLMTYNPVTNTWDSKRGTVSKGQADRAFPNGTPRYDTLNQGVMRISLCNDWLRSFHRYPPIQDVTSLRIVVMDEVEESSVWFGLPEDQTGIEESPYILIGNEAPLRVPVSIPVYSIVADWYRLATAMYNAVEYREKEGTWRRSPIIETPIPPAHVR